MATPPGRGGIGIVRLSGGGIADLCRALIGALPPPRHAHLCTFRAADGTAMDRGLALYFPAPHSYTGEPVLELHGHGNPVVLNMVVRRCLALGARAAEPGEFSRRAFLNGRMDLAQAEAVADLIASDSERAARAAVHSLQGEFSSHINHLVAELTELRVWIEGSLDFPDEGIDLPGDHLIKAVLPRLLRLQRRFNAVDAAARHGRLLRDGLKVVLSGAPNTGKSSLLNALTGQPRAIISAEPGTTRDLLTEHVTLHGMTIELTDTAGLREDGGEIEAEGMRRAAAACAAADVILWVVDDSAAPAAAAPAAGDTPCCVVHNKIDVSGRAPGGDHHEVAVSALRGDGMDALRRLIAHHAGLRTDADDRFMARTRHVDALRRAAHHLEAGLAHLRADGAAELLAEELGACQRILGEITGTVTSDDLLGAIFATFCIGK